MDASLQQVFCQKTTSRQLGRQRKQRRHDHRQISTGGIDHLFLFADSESAFLVISIRPRTFSTQKIFELSPRFYFEQFDPSVMLLSTHFFLLSESPKNLNGENHQSVIRSFFDFRQQACAVRFGLKNQNQSFSDSSSSCTYIIYVDSILATIRVHF